MISEKLNHSKRTTLIVSIIVLTLYLVISQDGIRSDFQDFIKPVPRVSLATANDTHIQRAFKNSSRLQAVRGDGNLGQFKRRFPTCLIIGSKKSGTGPLRVFLDIHPKIKVTPTERHFFDNDLNYEKGFEYYRKQMPKSYPDQITIEKSPMYFISKRATKRIFNFYSKMKLIVILRHPVKRMISDFWHEKRVHKNRYQKEFEQLVFENRTGKVDREYEAVNMSLYYIHIKRYLEYFPRHQLHVVDGENFIVNPVEEISKIETFLGLEHFVTKDKVFYSKKKGYFCFIKNKTRECLDQTKGHSHSELDKKLIQKLKHFFEPYNKKLFELIGQEFDWR